MCTGLISAWYMVAGLLGITALNILSGQHLLLCPGLLGSGSKLNPGVKSCVQAVGMLVAS